MAEMLFIPNQPPAAAENPYWLKSQGIQALMRMVREQWSLYNDVDPGVTLLEHLCWALAEIAYCANFPLEDLLAGPDGALAVPDQFPAQTAILSHQPVSADDQAKILFDSLPDLRAARLLAETDGQGRPTGREIWYLAARPGLGAADQEQLRQGARHLLARWRLPGHALVEPRRLTPRILGLTATVMLADGAQAQEVTAACVHALDQLVAPTPQRHGYHSLRDKGLEGGAIINGPALTRGWIQGPLPQPPDTIRISTIAPLLAAIDGVKAVLELTLAVDGKPVRKVTLDSHEIAEWTLDLEVKSGDTAHPRHQGPTTSDTLPAMRAAHQARGIQAGLDRSAPVPRGRFRDPAGYHPVQSTLPPNWRMSDGEVNRTPLEMAQMRQLRGYLLPFEQLLANQFAQLGNLGRLFSPAFPPPPEPGDRPEEVPWQPLARTSFSQPLYQIPDIRDIVDGHDVFDDWQGEPRPGDSWHGDRRSPANPYRHALATLTESEEEAVVNRVAMLRHLLARHGEDMAEYDTMILAFRWYGSRDRTLMIVYGLWLRNLVFLSHARCCGARYPAPDLALPGAPGMAEGDPRLSARVAPEPGLPAGAVGTPWWQRLRAWPEFNGRPDLTTIERIGTFDDADLDGIGSFELKLDLVLDLPTSLANRAAALLRALAVPGVREWLSGDHPAGQSFHIPDSDLWLTVTAGGVDLCDRTGSAPGTGGEVLLEIRWDAPGARTGWPDAWQMACHPGAVGHPVGTDQDERFLTCHAHALQLLWLATQRRGVLLVEPVLLSPDGGAGEVTAALRAGLYWPDWVPLFRRRLPGCVEMMRRRHWPLHVALDARGLSFAELAGLIPAFVAWHNLHGRADSAAAEVARCAAALAARLPGGGSP